jgi:transposase-like protein
MSSSLSSKTLRPAAKDVKPTGDYPVLDTSRPGPYIAVMSKTRKAPAKPSMTFSGLLERFPDEAACKAFLASKRWPDAVSCPRCGNAKVYALKARPFHWQCKACAPNGYRFSVTAGTIFENTNAPLRLWFQVAFLMVTAKKGMSAMQVQRTLGIKSYETAWYMCHRIRAAMQNEDFVEELSRVVERDRVIRRPTSAPSWSSVDRVA